MATNLIRGWHQRLDGANARKVAFGACHVFGEEPKVQAPARPASTAPVPPLCSPALP